MSNIHQSFRGLYIVLGILAAAFLVYKVGSCHYAWREEMKQECRDSGGQVITKPYGDWSCLEGK